MTECDFNSFMTEVPYHIETSPFVCSADQRTGFYGIGMSIMKFNSEIFYREYCR